MHYKQNITLNPIQREAGFARELYYTSRRRLHAFTKSKTSVEFKIRTKEGKR